MKTTKSSTVDLGRPTWPYGNYCIYKKSFNCPTGLSPGWVLWDDENGQNGINLNVKNGSVPKGEIQEFHSVVRPWDPLMTP